MPQFLQSDPEQNIILSLEDLTWFSTKNLEQPRTIQLSKKPSYFKLSGDEQSIFLECVAIDGVSYAFLQYCSYQ